jgi:hypothetical protein
VSRVGHAPTFLALARAAVPRAKYADISLCVRCTECTKCLGFVLLVHVAEDVAIHAAELPFIGLKVTCASNIVMAHERSEASTSRGVFGKPCIRQAGSINMH